MKPGIDYIGVGVGALIMNNDGKILLCLRGKKVKNEHGKWEIPGGSVEWGDAQKMSLSIVTKKDLEHLEKEKKYIHE